MAKSNNDDTSNRLLWIAGGAAVSAFAMFYVNRYLNEREELKRLHYDESRRTLAEGSKGDE